MGSNIKDMDSSLIKLFFKSLLNIFKGQQSFGELKKSVYKVFAGYSSKRISFFVNKRNKKAKVISEILEWIVPYKGVNYLDYILKKLLFKMYFKHWGHEQVDTNLHALPYFALSNKKSYWLSINKESRPGIIIDKEVVLPVDVHEESLDWIQLGVAAKEEVDKVEFFANDILIGVTNALPTDRWIDIRLNVKTLSGQINLKIIPSGKSRIFCSHPLLDKKIHTNVKKNTPQNIICIIVDGIRPESLPNEVTPNINNFFDSGVTCSQAYTQGDWTLPAFSSILSGLYPSKHGVFNPTAYEIPMPESIEMLPNLLRENGFRTFAYSNNKRFTPPLGHAKGFERFICRTITLGEFYAQQISEAIMHLEAHKSENNFVLLHFFDSHIPFEPFGYLTNTLMEENRDYNARRKLIACESMEQYADYMENRLSSKLYELDIALNMLFSYCRDQSWFEESNVILSSDHAFPFTKKDKPLLLENRIRVPLKVKGPSIIKKYEDSLIAANVDLYASILKIAGISHPNNIDGRCWPFIEGEKRQEVFSEAFYSNKYSASIRDESYAYHFECLFHHKFNEVFYDKKNQLLFIEGWMEMILKARIYLMNLILMNCLINLRLY